MYLASRGSSPIASQQLDALPNGFRIDHQPRPDPLHELVEGHDVGCRSDEHEQQIERKLRDRDVGVSAADDAPSYVDPEIVDPVYIH